jgi:peroxiredoxin
MLIQSYLTDRYQRVIFEDNVNSLAVYKITNLFRNTGLNIAYKPSNTIRHLLQPKHNFDPFTQSGIYQICCVSCNRMYVGQSGREIGTRYKEHI